MLARQVLCLPLLLLALASCGCGSSAANSPNAESPSALASVPSSAPPIVVNSLLDSATPESGSTTLRSALALAAPGQTIQFAPALDGGTISLSLIADEHTLLKGEVMGIRNEPSGPVSYLVGYSDRDYGRSSLLARKNVIIDASSLPSGITVAWGGAQPGARVLAVDGDLTLTNVDIRGGRSLTENNTTVPDQPWTLARGGALAVWGVARLNHCRLYDNQVQGDFDASRDRGAFGGGIYADIVEMDGCVVSGNSVLGGGAAGGGVYCVGGAGHAQTVSTIDRSSITGNRISGLMTYGGGVFSDGGSIGNHKKLRLTRDTIAQNLAQPAPGLPKFLLSQGYWRGGGVYISNGDLEIQSCSLVENQVQGVARTDSLGRRNLAGGIAATVGNAHEVGDMTIGHSIIAGNTVQEIGGTLYPHDIFTGSLMGFHSGGYNRVGVVDFSQILVPVGRWESLCRKHYPQAGDETGTRLADVLDLSGGITRSTSIVSAGVDSGQLSVLYYQPQGTALHQVPTSPYLVPETLAQYSLESGNPDNFLAIMLSRLESHYGLTNFASNFTADFETFLQTADSDAATPGIQPYTTPSGTPILTLAATQWFGPAQTWPKELPNYPYIQFWHRLDAALQLQAIPGMGAELLGDSAWQSLFSSGSLTENPSIRMDISTAPRLSVQPLGTDQLGKARPTRGPSDIGSIEGK